MTDIKPDMPHKDFAKHADDYELVKDFYQGVGAVRDKGTTHLPKTSGMLHAADQKRAEDRYKAFVMRATYPGMFRHTVSSVVGITTQKELAEFKIPGKWESIQECATRDGAGLRALQGLCVRQVAKMGRVGLLTDLRSDEEEVPVIVPFFSDQIINWRTALINGKRQLSLLVLKKTDTVQGQDYWSDSDVEVVEAYELTRVGLLLRRFEKNGGDTRKEWVEVPVPQPRARKQASGMEALTDETSAGFRLNEIPFTPITPQGLQIDPVDPPFLDLVHKLKDIYIGSANYREALSMYEPTPVITGLTDEWAKSEHIPKQLGAGVLIKLPEGGDAKMLEYQGRNIADIRQALIDDAAEAERLATQPFERITAQAESGESKKEKAKSKTNVIREIHLATGNGMQEAFRKGARWTGENEDQIIIKVSDDLDNQELTPQELKEIRESWMSGMLPDSDTHSKLKAGGYSNLTLEEWKVEREGGETGAI